MKNIKNYDVFLNEKFNLLKNKTDKLKDLEKKYVGNSVKFKIKTTNHSGIEIPSNIINFKRKQIGEKIIERIITNITFTPNKNIEIKFKSLTGEHLLINNYNIKYLDGISPYGYMFELLELLDIENILIDIKSLKLIKEK